MGILQLFLGEWAIEVCVGEALVEEIEDISEAIDDDLDSFFAQAFTLRVDEVYEVLIHSLNHSSFRWKGPFISQL